MTKVEYINAFQSDINSFINFVLLNNPKALITSLKAAGYKDVQTYDDARKTLLAIFAQGKIEEFQRIMNAVPYLNDVQNDTAGFKDYFLAAMTPEQRANYDANVQAMAVARDSEGNQVNESGSLWLTIGSGAVSVISSIFGAKKSIADATLLQQQQLAAQAQTQKILLIGGIIVVSLILLFLGVWLVRRNKKG